MIVLVGIMIVVLLVRQRDNRLSRAFIIKTFTICCIAVLALFVAFGVLRGATGADFLVSSFLGYTVSSYNRLAAMLAGVLHYPYSGHGLYISAFASFNNSFNTLTGLRYFLDWPTFDTVWRSEFDAVSAAGLDGELIWSGAPGYAFADLGWFSPFLFFIYGAITAWAWRSLHRGNIAGIIIYPWCAFCTLFWFGTNYYLDSKFADLVLVMICLYVYEKSCLSIDETR